MNPEKLAVRAVPPMTEPERVKISAFIEREFGIKMPASKKSLLEGRMAKRLGACGCNSYDEYFTFVTRNPQGRDEFLLFADLVSTHETSFFREPRHFDYLAEKVVPTLAADRDRRSVTILSAACSTGEEAYSMAMVVDRGLVQARRPQVTLAVEGVDLSDRAVAIASRGVYLADRTKSISPDLRTQYLMLSKDSKKGLCRIIPELRAKTRFHTGNLLGDLGLENRLFDIIFCRNVLIYFEPDNQRKVIQTLLNHLEPHGLLFLGHSESMVSLHVPIRPVAHAVYQRAGKGEHHAG